MDTSAAFDELLAEFYPPSLHFTDARARAVEKSRILTAAQWAERHRKNILAAAVLYSYAARQELILVADEASEIPIRTRLLSAMTCLVKSGERPTALALFDQYPFLKGDPDALSIMRLPSGVDSDEPRRWGGAFRRKDWAQAKQLLSSWSRNTPLSIALWACTRTAEAAGASSEARRFLELLCIAAPHHLPFHILTVFARRDAGLETLRHAAQIARAFDGEIGAQALLVQEYSRPSVAIDHDALASVTHSLEAMLRNVGRLSTTPHAHALIGFVACAKGLRMINEPDRAIEILRLGIDRYPQDTELRTYLGVCLLRTGREEEAIDTLEIASYIPSGRSFWPGLLTGAILLNRELSRAGRALRESINRDAPALGRAAALNELAVASVSLQDFNMAATLLERAAALLDTRDETDALPEHEAIRDTIVQNRVAVGALRSGAIPIVGVKPIGAQTLLRLVDEAIVLHLMLDFQHSAANETMRLAS